VLTSDQLNSSTSQQLLLGPAALPAGDAPLPPWALLLLGAALFSILLSRRTRTAY
jgi:hypothetical protein